eukprot:TRINITY_DN11256_c0_g1_i1.p1 TRINITY_DN11256_c0_g1~~TRINITY_DN11256_c0_g1_i1.p1  ORF type:complete len:533 (+),score=156.64 TRINITY_DN11256_c0_g1_i1:106-1599(+)
MAAGAHPERAPGAERRLSVAVVGTGISGLTAAYLLSRKHSVDAVFEAHPIAGMDSQSVTVAGKDGGPRVDVPVRSFSPHYYPSLVALYRHLGLALQRVDYSSSMSRLGGESLFVYSNLKLGPYTLPFVVPCTRSWRIAREWVYFQGRCWWHRRLHGLQQKTFDQWCREGGHSHMFYEEWLLPICSSMLSCSIDTVRQYPADILVEFFSVRQSTFFTSWFRVETGTADVCARLLSEVPAERQHFNTRISRIAPCRGGSRVQVTAADGRSWEFDHVIVATEAAHVLAILGDPSAEEQEVFRKFRYEPSHAVIHTDAALMPRRRAEWRTMNSFLPPTDGRDQEEFGDGSTRERCPGRYGMSTVTVWVNTLIDVPPELGNVFQTWNPHLEPDPETVLHKAQFLRAVHDRSSSDALERLHSIQGQRRVWFCGSYASRGMTLLEQACVSAIRVSEAFGVPPPWQAERPERRAVPWVLLISLLVALVAAAAYSWLAPAANGVNH